MGDDEVHPLCLHINLGNLLLQLVGHRDVSLVNKRYTGNSLLLLHGQLPVEVNYVLLLSHIQLKSQDVSFTLGVKAFPLIFNVSKEFIIWTQVIFKQYQQAPIRSCTWCRVNMPGTR